VALDLCYVCYMCWCCRRNEVIQWYSACLCDSQWAYYRINWRQHRVCQWHFFTHVSRIYTKRSLWKGG